MTVRRRRPEGPAVPERYARFVRSEWPAGLSAEAAVDAWADERERWAVANEFEWPEGYPTSPLGDWLDRMRAKREAWMLNCCTTPAEASNGRGRR